MATENAPDRVTTFMEHLLSAGVPVRVLVEHGVHSLSWLEQRTDSLFRIAYKESAGAHVVEDLRGAASFLIRAEELGWKPNPADDDGQFLCYDNAIYREYRGVHWHDTEIDEGSNLPAALPESALRAARDKERQAMEAAARRRAAAERTKQREQDRSLRDMLGRMARREQEQEQAAVEGRPISTRTAALRAKKTWSDIVVRMKFAAQA